MFMVPDNGNVLLILISPVPVKSLCKTWKLKTISLLIVILFLQALMDVFLD